MALQSNSNAFSHSPEFEMANTPSANDSSPDIDDLSWIDSFSGEIAVAGTSSTFSLDIPQNPVDKTVNVVIYGFAGCDAAYRGLAKAMTQEQGLITMTCQLSRFQHPKAALHPSHLTKPTALTSKIVRASIGALPNYGLSDRVNLFGHSMGGWIGAELAAHKPHIVDNLVLFGSAGLIDHSPLTLAPGIPKLLGRIAFDLATRRPDAIQPRHAVDTLKHIVSNPVLTVGEAMAVSKCNIRETLQSIDGPTVAVLHPTDDEFFDAGKVAAATASITPHVTLLDGLGHGAPITHPSEVAQAYANMLNGIKQQSALTS